MDHENKRIRDRMRLHELLIQEPSWSHRDYARVLDRDEKWVRKWKKRLQDHPYQRDFSIYESHSRAPKTVWCKTPEIVKDAICDLREYLSDKYNRTAGADTILPYLRQREDLKDADHFVPNGTSTINTVLHERGYIQPPRPRWRKPLILPEPMSEWEMDFGEVKLPNGDRFEFFAVIDCGTSHIMHLVGSEGFNAETALQEVATVLLLRGCPKVLRFDRDSRFVGSWTRDGFSSPLVKFLKVMGVKADVCPPRKPWKKPFIERLIYTIKHEWLFAKDYKTIADLHDLLPQFVKFYLFERIHQGKACKGQIPTKAFTSLPRLPYPPETVDPNSWLDQDHKRLFRRRVTSNGTLQIDRQTYYVGMEFAKSPMHVYVDADQREFVVAHENKVIKRLAIRGLYEEEMTWDTYVFVMMQEARSIERYRQMMWQRRGDDT